MEIYQDENIRLELKNRNMSKEEILALMFWLLTVNGHSRDITLDDLEDEFAYYEDLR